MIAMEPTLWGVWWVVRNIAEILSVGSMEVRLKITLVVIKMIWRFLYRNEMSLIWKISTSLHIIKLFSRYITQSININWSRPLKPVMAA